LFFVGVPLTLALSPVPFDVVTMGVVGAEREHYVRVATPGTFQTADVAPGDFVERGGSLMQLSNERVQEDLNVAIANLEESTLKWQVARERDVVESARIEARIRSLQLQLSEALRRDRELQIVSPDTGYVLSVHGALHRGEFLKAGQPIAMVADGNPVLRLWLNQGQLNDISQDDVKVRFRMSGSSEQTFWGRITSIQPAAESVLTEQSLTNLGGGDLVVDPHTGRPMEALFKIEIAPDRPDVLRLDHHGRRIAIALPRAYESVSSWTFRKCLHLLQQLLLA
jgi:multidrug resistance efflux pump